MSGIIPGSFPVFDDMIADMDAKTQNLVAAVCCDCGTADDVRKDSYGDWQCRDCVCEGPLGEAGLRPYAYQLDYSPPVIQFGHTGCQFTDGIARWKTIVSRAANHYVGTRPSTGSFPFLDSDGIYHACFTKADAPRAKRQPGLFVAEPTAIKTTRRAAAKRAKAARKVTRRARA
jgi:hypothetical protein